MYLAETCRRWSILKVSLHFRFNRFFWVLTSPRMTLGTRWCGHYCPLSSGMHLQPPVCRNCPEYNRVLCVVCVCVYGVCMCVVCMCVWCVYVCVVCVCVCFFLLMVLCGCETPSHTLDLRKWITKQNGKDIFVEVIPLSNLTFIGPCIVMYSYNESQRDSLFLRFIW